MATKAQTKTPGSRTASVKGVVREIEAVLRTIDKSTASNLKKARARMLLMSVLGLIRAFCLANARKKDLSESEFEVKRRGKKKTKR